MDINLFYKAVREQNGKIIAENAGSSFPVAMDHFASNDVKESVVYTLLAWKDEVLFEDYFEPHVVTALHTLKEYIAANNLKGTITFYYLRNNILRYEIFEEGTEFVYQLEFHLSNGSFCLSKDFVPIVQTCINRT